VGYEEGGQLTEAVRRHPYAVILLDEIDKAHPDVFNILLQLLDDGRLTDNQGRTVNFKNTIVIMTSNIGSQLIQERLDQMTDENADEIMGNLRVVLSELLRRTIRPEFLNRIDDVVLFKPLTKKEIRKIVEIQLSLVSKMLAEKEMKIVMDEDAKDWLAELGFDVAYGARPLKRTIQRYVINPLSQEILSGKFVDGDTIHISTGPRAGLEFRKA
jgi:ATP-dependent Clp protease ATP-binding subunit ClpB